MADHWATDRLVDQLRCQSAHWVGNRNDPDVRAPNMPLRSAGSRNSFILKNALHVSFAVQDTNDVHGVCLETVINPNRFKSGHWP